MIESWNVNVNLDEIFEYDEIDSFSVMNFPELLRVMIRELSPHYITQRTCANYFR